MASHCELMKDGLVRFCYECERFPCERLKRLDKRYSTKYGMSMIENLNYIKQHGLDSFLSAQEKRWKCKVCGEATCCHTHSCLSCEDDLKISNAALEDVFTHKTEHYCAEVRMRHKNGSWVWVLDNGKVLEWTDEGKPLIVAGTHIDITNQKEAQLRAEKSEQNLSQIIENSINLIYRIDLNGNFTYISSTWHKRMGHDVKAATGSSFRPFIHPDDLPRVNSFFEVIKETGQNQELGKYRLRHKDGTRHYFESTASPIFENEQVIGFSGIARDITELVKTSTELTKKTKSWSAFSPSVSISSASPI